GVFLLTLVLIFGAVVVATPKPAEAITCGFGSAWGADGCRGYLTTADTSPWTVPGDWNNASNTVELIGAGGGGQGGTTVSGGGSAGASGGGGAYTKLSNGAVSGTVSFSVGTGGTGTLGQTDAASGGVTYWE